MKIGFIPIDNRPVCFGLPKLIMDMDESVEIFSPERNLLGDLEKIADIDSILEWAEEIKDSVDVLIISLDTVAYGGLVPSRRSRDSLELVKSRLQRLKRIITGKKVYAFSSIMRIANNNINQEEKIYWDKWGKKIFEYSYNFHKFGTAETDVPTEILEDYILTRKRNFELNKLYLKWEKEGIFDTLIFSKDDCAEFGMNIQEANSLQEMGAKVKTGADEIPLALLARTIDCDLKIAPIFIEESQKHLVSNYEDISIEQCVKNQIKLAGCSIADEAVADLILYVNNFIEHQGELVMKIPTKSFDKIWAPPQKPYAVADVRFANGSDNSFVQSLFNVGLEENFLGYSAWNTSANSLGSLILALKVIFRSKMFETFNKCAFEKLILTRFLDDWAYQANVREELSEPNLSELKQKMSVFEQILFAKFPHKHIIDYKFPWNRLFEVEVDVN